MDELTIDGKIYVSSKRAAAITGYAKDYIGQLCREGRVEAKLVGRSWYVYEPSLKKHRFSDSQEAELPKAETAWGGVEAVSKKEATSVESSEKPNIQAVWDVPTYMPEEVTALPELNDQPEPAMVPEPPQETAHDENAAPLSDMQSAWQEWFSTRPSIDHTPAEEPVASVREEAEPSYEARTYAEPQNVPLRTIVSDIAPIERHDEPVRLFHGPTHVPERHVVAESVMGRPKGRKRSAKSVRRLVQVVLIGLITVSLSIAIVSTGLIDALHLGGTADTSFVRFIEGEHVIKK